MFSHRGIVGSVVGWIPAAFLISLVLGFSCVDPDPAVAWTASSVGDGYAVRIEREAEDTGTATAWIYGTNAQPSAAQLASGSWDTTGASAWMGSTVRAQIAFDSTDDTFEWYSSTVSPSLIYCLVVIETAAERREQEVVTMGAWHVDPVYIAEKPPGYLWPAARTTTVTVIGTAAVDIQSMASSVSVDGTLPVAVTAFGGYDGRALIAFGVLLAVCCGVVTYRGIHGY